MIHPEWKRAMMGESNPITIATKDGREFKKTCVISHGDPEDPLTDDEVKHKYMMCVEGILSDKNAEKGAELVFALDELRDVSELMEILTYP
jgi:hypothetical protein